MRYIICFLLTFMTSIYSLQVENTEEIFSSIKSLLSEYRRPFTILDYDSLEPSLLFKIADTFPNATCIICGKNEEYLTSLMDVCKEHPERKNIILLTKSLSAKELKTLAHTEHFDVMLAFNSSKVKNFFSSAKVIADHVVVTSGENNETKILTGNGSLKLKKHWFSSEKPSMQLQNTDYSQFVSVAEGENFWSHNVIRPSGISLVTFLALDGAYPEKSSLLDQISHICWNYYSHLAPWNLIVTGKDLVPFPIEKETNFCKNTKELAIEVVSAQSSELESILVTN